MKKFTQEEFDNLEVNECGFRLCPTGDYSEIKKFGHACFFADDCTFGNDCTFGILCTFGNRCTFGGRCDFDGRCGFGSCCKFVSCCKFDKCCEFGERCKFDKCCDFGECCKFGNDCIFCECCNFENGKVKNGRFITVARIGSASRTTYFFGDENKNIFVQCGCFFGTDTEFFAKVEQTHKGSVHEKNYKAALAFAKIVLLD